MIWTKKRKKKFDGDVSNSIADQIEVHDHYKEEEKRVQQDVQKQKR